MFVNRPRPRDRMFAERTREYDANAEKSSILPDLTFTLYPSYIECLDEIGSILLPEDGKINDNSVLDQDSISNIIYFILKQKLE